MSQKELLSALSFALKQEGNVSEGQLEWIGEELRSIDRAILSESASSALDQHFRTFSRVCEMHRRICRAYSD